MALNRLDRTRQQALSVSVATGAYGISFGALSIAAGLDIWQTLALSLLLFTGGSQFAFVGVIGSGGSPIAAVATSTFLSIRHSFYGVALSPIMRPLSPPKRALAAQFTIDETSAVALSQPSDRPDLGRTGFWWTGWGIYVLWAGFTWLGGFLGQQIGDPRAWGLDAAAAGAFLGLVWSRLATRQARLVALGAAALAVLCTPVLPAGFPILVAASLAVIAGWSAQTSVEEAADD